MGNNKLKTSLDSAKKDGMRMYKTNKKFYDWKGRIHNVWVREYGIYSADQRAAFFNF